MPGKEFLLCSSPTSKACYAQAPTDILPPYIKPVMPRLLHYHPSPIYIKPIMPRFQHMLLTCIKPVMLGLLHHHPSPVSSLLFSGSYIMPAMVRPQHVSTDIKPAMPRPLHH